MSEVRGGLFEVVVLVLILVGRGEGERGCDREKVRWASDRLRGDCLVIVELIFFPTRRIL